MNTLSTSGPKPIAPRAVPDLDLPTGDDEFEAFGGVATGMTSTFGNRPTGRRGAAQGGDAAATADPFAASDPFGSDDPFAGGFGRGKTGADKRKSDPFGASAAEASDKDPFSFGGAPGATGDIDFDSLLGEVGKAPAGRSGGRAPAGPSTDDDSLFGGGDEDDSLFLATSSTSGALFDAAEEEAPLTRKRKTNAGVDHDGAPTHRKKGDDERPKRDMGVAIDRLIVVLIAALCVGLALDYAGIPLFGLGEVLSDFGLGESEKDRAKREAAARPVAQNLLEPTEIKDTFSTYALEISRLRQVYALRPDDAAVRGSLVAAMLDLYQRYPLRFMADPDYKRELAAFDPLPPRAQLITSLGEGTFDGLAKLSDELAKIDGVSPDDLSVAVSVKLALRRAALRQNALDQPGKMAQASHDPLHKPEPENADLVAANGWIKRALSEGKAQNNRIKFEILAAEVDDAMGAYEAIEARLADFVAATPNHFLAHVLLASAYIERNRLAQAAPVIRALATGAQDVGDDLEFANAMHLEARLAARRGRSDDQIIGLLAALEKSPDDELTTVRLGRLFLAEKRAQECQKLLVDAKQRGMKSIAFEVALVEYWLWAHRYEDALAELKIATAAYPDAVDLLFLRGQVEEKQQHTATARDYFARVLEREPDHLQAALRLAELQRVAGKLDDAVFTLRETRRRVGDLEEVLEPLAQALLQLKVDTESRALYAILLQKAPSNKRYLLEAARMDLRAGQIDRALGYLRVLREERALDREGAIALALGLASKGKSREAADTLLPFAEREPNSVELNALTGRYLLDADDFAHAETLLARAHAVALRSGGDAETQFQYGRLAFRKQEVENGISRIQQAIAAEPTRHRYRFELAQSLTSLDRNEHRSAPKVAISQLEYLVAHAPRFAAAKNPVDYLAEVHRRAARLYADEARWEKAIPHLRTAHELEPNHLETQVLLGTALFQVNDPDAEKVLRRVVAKRPNDGPAALYLGLTLIAGSRSSEALSFLERAAATREPSCAVASYHAALIYKDRNLLSKAAASLRTYLARAPADSPFRVDAKRLLDDVAH